MFMNEMKGTWVVISLVKINMCTFLVTLIGGVLVNLYCIISILVYFRL
jgi:hypothetical protein